MLVKNILYIEDNYDEYCQIAKGFKNRFHVKFFPDDSTSNYKDFIAFFSNQVKPIFNTDNKLEKTDELKNYIYNENIDLIIIDVNLNIDSNIEGKTIKNRLSEIKKPIILKTVGTFSDYQYIVNTEDLGMDIDSIIDDFIQKTNEQIAPSEVNFILKDDIQKDSNLNKTDKTSVERSSYQKQSKIRALSSLFGRKTQSSKIAYINKHREKNDQKVFTFKNGYDFQIVFISFVQYFIEFCCTIFLLIIGFTSLWKIGKISFLYLIDPKKQIETSDSALFIGEIISGIEYLFLAPLPYLIAVGYLRTYTIRYPLDFDKNLIPFEKLQEKKFFIGSLIGIVATNLVKVLLNLPNNYFVWRAIFINLIFPIIAHIAVISILIYFYNKLSKKYH